MHHPKRRFRMRTHFIFPLLASLVVNVFINVAFAQAPIVPKLNDTGVDLCYDSSVVVACAPASKDTGTHPRQDGRYGRDKKLGLPKTGNGAKGFDYTKICNSGQSAGSGTCPANPVLGPSANDWGCTKDNVTSLVWEIKTAGATGLRSAAHTYSWYSTNTATNGGSEGSVGGNTCAATLPSSQCNTQAFVTAVNAVGLCGATDWRLPNRKELHSILDYGKPSFSPAQPVVDMAYFPNTQPQFYWSNNSVVSAPTSARYASFLSAIDDNDSKSRSLYVHLVRGGQ
jgi:Protein of unknown function (DUF1566)